MQTVTIYHLDFRSLGPIYYGFDNPTGHLCEVRERGLTWHEPTVVGETLVRVPTGSLVEHGHLTTPTEKAAALTAEEVLDRALNFQDGFAVAATSCRSKHFSSPKASGPPDIHSQMPLGRLLGAC